MGVAMCGVPVWPRNRYWTWVHSDCSSQIPPGKKTPIGCTGNSGSSWGIEAWLAEEPVDSPSDSDYRQLYSILS